MMSTRQQSTVVLFLTIFIIDKCVSQSNYGGRIEPKNIDCVQCNMRQFGIVNTCKAPAQRHNCTGCMKTVTTIKIKDSGTMTGKYRISEVVSRFCMMTSATGGKPEGCYRHMANGGYQEQCFCYTPNCNSKASMLDTELSTTVVVLFLTLTFVKMMVFR